MTDPPDGAFVLVEDSPWVIVGPHALRWTPAGYVERRARPARAALVTPPSLVGVLRAGWDPVVPLLHPSASNSQLSITDSSAAPAPARR